MSTKAYSRPDFTRIRGTPIEDVLDMLGIDLKKRGKQLRGHCPICGHQSPRAFTVTPDLNRFWCFGDCRGGGDVIELVSRVKQLSQYEAACYIAKNYSPP